MTKKFYAGATSCALALLYFNCAFAQPGIPTDAMIKAVFNYDSWPGLEAPLKQPLDFRIVAAQYLGGITSRGFGSQSAHFEGENGEFGWGAFETCTDAKYALIKDAKYSQMPLLTTVEEYGDPLINTIGDVEFKNDDNEEELYVRKVSRNNYCFYVILYSDTTTANAFASTIVSMIDAAPVIQSLSASPSIPVIRDLSMDGDLFSADSTSGVLVQVSVTPGIQEIINCYAGVTADDKVKSYPIYKSSETLYFTIYNRDIVGANYIEIDIYIRPW